MLGVRKILSLAKWHLQMPPDCIGDGVQRAGAAGEGDVRGVHAAAHCSDAGSFNWRLHIGNLLLLLLLQVFSNISQKNTVREILRRVR
jgi:hypothetical protein